MLTLLGTALLSYVGLHIFLSFIQVEHPEDHSTVDQILSTTLVAVATLGLGLGLWAMRRLRRELSARTSAHTEALALAQHDPLTGLPNRRRLLEAFPALTRETDPDSFRAVLMLDLDGFKPINDVYGHTFGDNLLRGFADRLTEILSGDGIAARLGGDEFAIVTPAFSEKSEASSFASRLLTRISDGFEVGERQISVGSGIGIALFPHDGHSMTELLRRADIALYRAKSSGRSTYRFFEVDMDASILHRTLLEQRLRQAISNRQVEVHFQPILNMDENRIAGFEALARWTDDDFGSVPPAQFIPIAEDSGVISELTDDLLERACRTASTWPEETFLSFNLSPVQLQDQSLPDKILKVLRTCSFPVERLVLEITETSLVKNPESARRILQALTDAGVSIALDDFGAGHSSLSYLRDFPIGKVKIDSSFTARMLVDKQCAAIVESILVLSKGLEIDAVAEGIEGKDIHEALSRNGCHYGQGFLYAKALPADEITKLLSAQANGGAVFAGERDPA